MTQVAPLAPAAETRLKAPRKAALSMYDLPELQWANDALWGGVVERLRARGVRRAPEQLTRDVKPERVWTLPDLLLAQTCGLPLAERLDGKVRVVATPRYRAQGCDGVDYRSAVVVRSDALATSLNDLRGARCAVNSWTSNSGMNLLRAEVAPLAAGRPFFGAVIETGAHLASVEAIADGAADVGAIDCVTWAHLQRWRPAVTSRLRVLSWTVRNPGLPLITSLKTSLSTLSAIRWALDDVVLDPDLKAARQALLLDGFSQVPAGHYRAALRLRDIAVDLGYPRLA